MYLKGDIRKISSNILNKKEKSIKSNTKVAVATKAHHGAGYRAKKH